MTYTVQPVPGPLGFEVWNDDTHPKCVVITPTEVWANAVARSLNIAEAARR